MNENTFLGQGWAFPPSFDNVFYGVGLSAGVDNINQSIDLLLKTPKGSRSLMPNFGSNLSSFVFQRMTAALQEELIQSVERTLLNFEPRIKVLDVKVEMSADAATVLVQIVYLVIQTNARHNHVFPFSVIEATNLPTHR